ncbi:MAG TPA: hypothetical protein VJI67_01800, partial [archaeon]|nr:hypothetical protein [archaeon]
ITAIGLPTSVTRAILGGAAIGGVYGLECKPDQDPHFGIPLPENTYCSRPSGVFEMCAAFKDEDPNHAFSSEETDYYFDVTFIPGGAQANVQKVELAKINNLEKQLALTGDCSGEQCNASPGNFVCSHSSVSNALGLEYYPPEWGVDELCAPQGVDPCVKDVNPVAFSSRIQADPVLAEAQKTLNDFVPCETELDSMKECCADGDGKKECEDADSSVVSNVEDCKEACKAGSKVQVKQGEEPKYLCEEKRNDWSECIKDDSRNGYGDEEKAAQEKIKEALEDYKRECASRTVSWSSTGLYGGRNGRDVIIESCGESGGC